MSVRDHKLSPEILNRVIEMAWEDRTPFEAIQFQFGLKEQDVRNLMKLYLRPRSYANWRERVESSTNKHLAFRLKDVKRFKSSRQRAISANKISKRR